MTTAVLVIDMQAGVLTHHPPAHQVDETVEQINRLTDAARARGWPVFFVQHDGPAGSGFLEPGTAAWQIHPALHRHDTDHSLRKHYNDPFIDTSLGSDLERLGVDRLLVCGYATDFCIDATVRRASGLGYDVTLVADAHTSKDRPVLTAEQIIAHYNWMLGELIVPGSVNVLPLDRLPLDG